MHGFKPKDEAIAAVKRSVMKDAPGVWPQPMIEVATPTAQATMTHVGMSDPQPGSMGGK